MSARGRVAAALVSYPPARFIGSELCTHGWMKALSSHFEVGAFVVDDDGARAFEGVQVNDQGDMWDFAPDLVVCHADFAQAAREYRYRDPGVKVVLVAHNERHGVLDGISMTMPDAVVATSKATADAIRAALPWCPVDVVNPPAPALDLRPLGDAVLQVNVAHDKGGPTFARLAEAEPGRRFIAVAGGYGEVPSALWELPNVEVIGHMPHAMMGDLIARARVVLAPSRFESWGMAVAEAVAMGRPVLAAPTPGLVENLGPESVYLDPDNLSEWRRALSWLDVNGEWLAGVQRAHRANHAGGNFTEVIERVLNA